MEFLDALEAEKFKKQKCIQFCWTEILDISSCDSSEHPQNFWMRSVHAHARMRHKTEYTHFIARARTYALCGGVHEPIISKIFVGVHYYHINLILKFYKDPSVHCGDICKTILTIKNGPTGAVVRASPSYHVAQRL